MRCICYSTYVIYNACTYIAAVVVVVVVKLLRVLFRLDAYERIIRTRCATNPLRRACFAFQWNYAVLFHSFFQFLFYT